MKLVRYIYNPILEANHEREWEAGAVFNCGATVGEDGLIYLLYRAVRRGYISKPNGQGYDNDRDYRIFYAHDDHCPQGTSLEDFECIEDDDMNFYLYEMEDLIYNTIPNEPDHWPEAEDYTFVRFNSFTGTKLQEPYPSTKQYMIHIPEIVFADRKIIEW